MRTSMWAVLVLPSLLAACGGGSSHPNSTPADVTVTVNGPTNSVLAGTTVPLEIVISNLGSEAALNVTIGGQFGSGITAYITGCSATGGAVCPQLGGAFTVPSLAGHGSLDLQVIAHIPTGLQGTINNIVGVAADNDSNANNNTAPFSIRITTSDLAVSGSGPAAPVTSGDAALYTMQLTNLGPDTATNVSVQNVVGPGQTLRTITCSDSGGAQCPAILAANMAVPIIPMGAKLTFVVTADVAATTIGTIVNTMYVTAPSDPITSNNVATASGTTEISVGTTSFIQLQSDAGDYIGQGRSYGYTKANASISLSSNANSLGITVAGDEHWNATIAVPTGYNQLIVGTYQATRFASASAAGLDWGGEGRGCNTITGTIIIDNVVYAGNDLSELDLRFEQHCEGGSAALRGQIHWLASDTTSPPGPQNPPPAGLWDAPFNATPTSGNYIYLQSDPGDFVGGGQTYVYTQANAMLNVSMSGLHLTISVNGNDTWTGDFQGMNSISELQTGYYGGLQRYPFNNPTRGGLDWSGNGLGCNTLTGWFVIDNITAVAGTLTTIDLRFEQHCEGGAAALHGKIHWIVGDTTQPLGPQNPPPVGLWDAASGTTPATGNYIYLTSDAGDYIGAGGTYVYTQADAVLGVSLSGGHLTVNVTGNENWNGDFQAMNSIAQLQPGYYGGLQRYPLHNPVLGGLDWSGNGRGCNTLTGWFVVDNITIVGGTLNSIDLRFEQYCEGNTAALHGKIHWIVGDTTQPPGPQSPPPVGLWDAPSGATPTSGNYVYLLSDSGDYIGAGQSDVYTPANATVTLSGSGRHASLNVNTNSNIWSGEFEGMNVISQLSPGYYGDLERWPFNNPVKGGLSWYGFGRGCNTLTGWFVVDSVSYTGGNIASLDLRFEQHCEGASSALRGKIHWVN